MAPWARHLLASKGQWHHLLELALVAKEDRLAGTACRSRIFSHDNGVLAFRTRHGLAGMAVFNLYGISAFVAVKNHPASSTELEKTLADRPRRVNPRLRQTATIIIDQNKKILHIFPQDQEQCCKKN